jgi:FtsP/CotA-like multicopper oxidase with cupredoxin domain
MEDRDGEDQVGAAASTGISRRDLLRSGVAGAVGLAAGAGALAGSKAGEVPSTLDGAGGAHSPDLAGTEGEVDLEAFDPSVFLKNFAFGSVSRLPSGQVQREYEMIAVDREIEVAPGVHFAAWTYNGTVPGPSIRCTEGDRLKVNFTNAGSHPHTIHFHGIHAAGMDGVFEIVEPGQSFIYEFDAAPMGFHLYHCHALPLKRHIHKGLYGAFIVDPPEGRPEANELMMLMNGFDTNFDGDNEVYAVNTVAFHYQRHPIEIEQGELVRVYLGNLTEFDLLNSFHLHGNFFRLYRTGTDLERHELTDTVMLCQGERAVLEFTYDHPGKYMFHAHQSEFAELGWMGVFDVKARGVV